MAKPVALPLWLAFFLALQWMELQLPAWAQPSAQGTGRVAVYVSNPRYLQDASGKPLLILGFGNEGRNLPFILDRLRGKITYQRAYAAWWSRHHDPNAYFGGRPWPMVSGKADMDVWNETYWTNLRDYVSKARDRGIIVGLTIWDGHSDLPGGKYGADSIWNAQYNRQGLQWGYDYEGLVKFPVPRPTGNARERLIYYQRRWLDRFTDELKNYPNVIIELNNEEAHASESWWLWWAHYFRERTGFVIAVNDAGSGGAISDDTFLQTPLVQMKSYHVRENRSIISTRLSYNKVIVADADDSCNNLDATIARKIAWRSFVKGGHWNDFVCQDVSFPDSAKIQGYGHLLQFINSRAVPFAEMAPEDQLVSTGHALAKPGRYYLAYVEGDVHLDLKAASGSLEYEWYDPKTGATLGRGTVQGGAIRLFPLPSPGDFVLWVRIVDAAGQ